MPPIVLTLLQGLFLLLLYIFVARAVRAVLRDISAPAPARPAQQRRTQRVTQPPAARAAQGAQGKGKKPKKGQPKRIAPGELVVHTPDHQPHVLALDGTTVTVGRSPEATVTLDDPYVSDHHAKMYRDGEEWLVVDEGSTNGTFLNQQKVTSATPLAAGDQLSIGKTVIEVRK